VSFQVKKKISVAVLRCIQGICAKTQNAFNNQHEATLDHF